MRDNYDFSKGKRGAVVKSNKERITIRLDPDIIRKTELKMGVIINL